MSFSESEHINILDFIDSLYKKYKSPELIADIIKEAGKLRRTIPILPGIVVMCLSNIVVKADMKSIKKNRKYLIITNSKKEYYGTIEIKKDHIIITGVKIKHDEIKKILTIDKEILKRTWPTLIHKEVER